MLRQTALPFFIFEADGSLNRVPIRGVQAFAQWQLDLRKARRTKRGTWHAWVERIVRDRDSHSSWSVTTLEHQVCQSRDAAVEASRKMLAKHSSKFDHDARVEANTCPDIEWPQYDNSEDRECQSESPQ